MVFSIFIVGALTLVYALPQDVSPSGRDYVPYTENYNVSFTHDGLIDYDILIAKIMPEIFEKKLRGQGVDIAQEDIVLNRGPQISMYQPQSYNCGYVIDYTDNQVYWLEAAINSTHIKYTRIFTETPTPDVPPDVDEFNLGWCFGPLKEQVATIFLEEKSHLTEQEEDIVAAAIKHELRGNPNLNNQAFTVGKFNFDYGSNVLAFCGEFQKPKNGLGFFKGAMKDGMLGSFGLESGISPLCTLDDNAKIHSIKTNKKSDVPSGLQAWKNLRTEVVYLKQSSVEKLLERNYMHTENVNYMILEYATSLKIKFIDFMLEDSNTIFTYEPIEEDTFVKIRVPQNGANYYMSYGPAEWNVGDLVDVTISVDNEIVKYHEFEFVRAPDAPYPQYFTDYIFKAPAGSSAFNVHLEIENYEPAIDHDPNEWAGYTPRE